MKFPPFEYLAPADLSGVIEALAAHEDARIIAGGQSLLPLMALRLARPSVLVDLDRVALDGVDDEPGVLRLGAMTRQSSLESDPIAAAAPLVAAAVRHVGHRSTRNLGTVGGSLAHADPAAELPAAMVALGASVVVASPTGTRIIPCSELALGYFTTGLGHDEVITEVRVPSAGPATGSAWCEWSPRAGDFADAGVGVTVGTSEDGSCSSVGAAACGVGPVPLDLTPVLSALLTGNGEPSAALLREVASTVEREASSELAGLLAARAVHRAFASLPGRKVAA